MRFTLLISAFAIKQYAVFTALFSSASADYCLNQGLVSLPLSRSSAACNRRLRCSS